jgi:hypothetical protein
MQAQSGRYDGVLYVGAVRTCEYAVVCVSLVLHMDVSLHTHSLTHPLTHSPTHRNNTSSNGYGNAADERAAKAQEMQQEQQQAAEAALSLRAAISQHERAKAALAGGQQQHFAAQMTVKVLSDVNLPPC